MATSPILLILGAGPRVGGSVADRFALDGYKVAIASRSGTDFNNEEGFLSLKADLGKPDSILAIFDAVKAEFHAAPSVVVYNAPAFTYPPDKDSALSVPVETFVADLNVNTMSPYAAAQQAVAGWETLPKENKKTFIYTGNILNVSVFPVAMMLTLGVGKSASSYWIEAADILYKSRGFRFFYADERTEDGKIIGRDVDSMAHAEFYAQLARQEEDIPCQATFVKNKGYIGFN
ncbi:uncharacterized protein NECHADRAFT_87650 [Fusarium vanettenii 77-13-4]|uniref:Short-chain dehydrogenase n=1 Tax=Fusarium vanettenii (strain ATCC MYA-4622 / CBS 123669 / FGSC 9596 / NRRL 45880 / 77-13-4) TaxID=660122 RepID=C7Z2M3_FUSV7|nr:uncharacterized protein NECHADRAFT_87650 [Fusarium vanettenii 77-13-4]EEU41501.1 hypothetical protein NECHADRAFT_87650 [Fusarium vanettenii 77-13-4]